MTFPGNPANFQGQPQQQQPLHPTVNYGQPGGDQAIVIPQGPPSAPVVQPRPNQTGFDLSQLPPVQQTQSPTQLPGQPQQQFTPQQFAPAQQPSTQPQGQPQQAPQAPQQPNRVQLNRDMVMDGPDVPPELRGRTVGQAMQIYTALASEWLQRQRPQGQAQPPRQAPAQPQQAGLNVPAGQPSGAAQAQNEASQFWQNPAGYIRQVVQEVNQPMLQQTQAQAVNQARLVAAQGISDFQQLEPAIIQALANVDPQALTDPNIWINAADLARGRMARTGQQAPRQNGAQQPFGPGASVPGFQAHQFFTEAPTPPSSASAAGMLTPEERGYAGRFGMSEDQYRAWKYGLQGQTTQGARQ